MRNPIIQLNNIHNASTALKMCAVAMLGGVGMIVFGSLTGSVASADDTLQEQTATNVQKQTDSEAATTGGSKKSDNSDKTKIDDDPLGLRKLPKEAEDIGVDSFIGETLNGDVLFNDSNNNAVKIADLFDGKRPVMLSFNYSSCPKLCSVQLENMTLCLREVYKKAGFKIGDDFQFVSISIDPNEQTSRAREAKEKYSHFYNLPDSDEGMHFLTGDKQDIRFMTDQCGFRFKYVPEQKLYSHPPVFILLSPEGKIVRYIHGLKYERDTIRLALVEAAQGKIGSPINILSYGLGCFTYNDSTGQYTFQAMAIMRIGAIITVLGLLIGLVPYWFFRKSKTNSNSESSRNSGNSDNSGITDGKNGPDNLMGEPTGSTA